MKEKKILMNYLLYILVFIGICIVGITKIFALETKTLYSTNSSGTLSNSNKYTYGYINQGGVQTVSTASINTTVNGRALALIYYMYEPVVLNKTYTMVVNFMSTDLINTFTSNMVQVATCNGDVCNDNAIVSVIKSNPTGWSNKITIEFNPITSGSVLLVNLSDKNATRLITGETTFGIKSVTLDSINQNEDIMNNANQNANNIISNNNTNTNAIIENQNANAQAIINAQYTCKVRSITLNDYIEYQGYVMNSSASLSSNSNYSVTELIKIKTNDPYTINLNYTTSNRYCLFDSNLNLIECPSYSGSREVNFNSNNAEYIRFTIRTDTADKTTFFGGNICLKDSEVVANQNEEAEKTRKGILGKLGDLISYINPSSDNFFLKLAFIPSSTFLENWYADFRNWIELKLGFLSTPITLFLDFINLYLNLNEEDIIINIPEITVPNFEEYTLIQAQTFNWSDLLESKQEFSTLWNLYLDFIDVFLILNFLGLCEVTYNRIFGGDTSQYEYYTTEETYSINDETGEATNHQLRQRRTRREKV